MKNAIISLSSLCCASLIACGTLLAGEQGTPRKHYWKLSQGAPPTAECKGEEADGPKSGPDRHHGMRDGGANMMLDIEIDNPEKAKELKALAESNPSEFKEKMKAAASEAMAKRKAEMDTYRTLVEQYRKSPSDSLKAQIKDKLASQFDRKIKIEELMLSKMKEKAAEAQKRLDEQKSKKDMMINLKLEDTLRDPSLRW